MPRLIINLRKIEDNSRLVAELLRPHGVDLVGVTKVCLGDPRVGKAMLAGGAVALADSRIQNIARLRRHLPDVRLQLMRPPGRRLPASGEEPDLFFVSSYQHAEHLSKTGGRQATRLCLMVETGDGREGVPPELAAGEAARISEVQGVELAGLATNAACSRQPASLKDTLSLFYEVSSQVARGLKKKDPETRSRPDGSATAGAFGTRNSFPGFPIMSAGGSGLLALILNEGQESGSGESPLSGLTELRCGEAILLGRIPAGGGEDLFLPGAHRDALVIEGRVLELYRKEGRTQALLDFGLQDVGTAPLVCTSGIKPRLATSDYLAVSCEEEAGKLRVGGCLTFIPTYYALLAAMTSPFVEKVFTK